MYHDALGYSIVDNQGISGRLHEAVVLTLIQFGSRLGLRHARCTLHAPSRGTRAAVPFRFMAGFAWYKVSRRGSYTYVHRPTWRTYHLTSRVREEGAGLVIHTSIVRSLFFPSADLGPARIRTWFDATHRESSHLATQVRLSDLAASCTGPAHAPRTLHDAFAHASAPSLPPRTSHALLIQLGKATQANTQVASPPPGHG